MSIRAHVSIREMNEQLNDFELGCDNAPEGTYIESKTVRAYLGETVDGILKTFNELGLKTPNSDEIREVEAFIYGYLRRANSRLEQTEAFGQAMETPARDRVIEGAKRDRDFLRSVGAII